jgi:hypothetical protein
MTVFPHIAELRFTSGIKAFQYGFTNMSGTSVHGLGGTSKARTSRRPLSDPMRLWLRFSDVRASHMPRLATDGRLLWLSSSVCGVDQHVGCQMESQV